MVYPARLHGVLLRRLSAEYGVLRTRTYVGSARPARLGTSNITLRCLAQLSQGGKPSSTDSNPMLQRLTRRSWTCWECSLRRDRGERRGLTTSTLRTNATTVSTREHVEPASRASSAWQHDDQTLRKIFDSPSFWNEFSFKQRSHYQARPVGLLQNRYLTSPQGFQTFAAASLEKCKRIVSKVLLYSSREEYKRIVRDLDRLSDLLCRVIDVCDFMRNVHPDPRIQAAASKAYFMMFEYMNVLNTTTGLNDQLKQASRMADVYNSWSEEEKAVAAMLEKDFSKSAIELPRRERDAFVALSNDIARLGTDFVNNMAAAAPFLTFNASSLRGMDPGLLQSLTRWRSVALPTVGLPATVALRSVEDPKVRKEIYLAKCTSSRDNLLRLEQLLKRRAELAQLSGHQSFGHMTLADKMARTPEAVESFLDAMSNSNAPRAQRELRELLELKKYKDSHPGTSGHLDAWDRDYYTAQLLLSLRSKDPAVDDLSAYFSLGTVMQGLSRLFHTLYGIRLVPCESLPGETWNADVRRLDVLDDREGRIAVIYCDLFERAGKSPNPAHFTLRCSRRIEDDEREAAVGVAQTDPLFTTPEEAVNDGLATNISTDDHKLYQLPTIALICDFSLPAPGHRDRPVLLTFREVTTLFHEMGHALHSICGRTTLQNVSGTRCATDLAELPSVLMESFASAPEVLALYARHWETDEPLDPSRVQQRVEADRRMLGAQIENNVLLSMLDQRFHSATPLTWSERGVGEHASSAVYHSVCSQYSSIAEPRGTSWQGFFGHLYGYGATYYSYLFDRAIAGKVWRDVFQRTPQGAVDPNSGRVWREEVLRWGGGKDGWRCVAGALGDQEGTLAEGGKGAMEMVGRWGVDH